MKEMCWYMLLTFCCYISTQRESKWPERKENSRAIRLVGVEILEKWEVNSLKNKMQRIKEMDECDGKMDVLQGQKIKKDNKWSWWRVDSARFPFLLSHILTLISYAYWVFSVLLSFFCNIKGISEICEHALLRRTFTLVVDLNKTSILYWQENPKTNF